MPHRKVRPHPDPGLGKRIQEARKALGLTQRQLADQLGTFQHMVSSWELDKNYPQDETLIQLATTLGIEIELPTRNEHGRRALRTEHCPVCGTEFPVFYGEKYCSRECAYTSTSEAQQGEKARNWGGGITKNISGYILIYTGKGRYIPEHRLVMEEHLGRKLEPQETVHHKNGVRDDNRLENLELWSGKHTPGVRSRDQVLDLLQKLSPEDRAWILAQI